MQHISRRDMMEARTIAGSVGDTKPDKPRGVTSGVASSFGLKRRVVSAPTDPVQRFGEVAMEADGKTAAEAPAINKFGFRSRSVSRAGSNSSMTSNHSSQTGSTAGNMSTGNIALVKKSVDNYRNTLLVTNNINKQPATKASPSLVKYRSTSEHSRPNVNRLAPTTGNQDSNVAPRNINRSGIPSLRPVSTSGIPSITKHLSSAAGATSNLPPRGNTRPISWGACPFSNGAAGYTDKTVKQVYNTRVRTASQSPAPTRTSRLQGHTNSTGSAKGTNGATKTAGGTKLPRSRRLEMVPTNGARYKFELKAVEVTQVVPVSAVKSEKKGTVYQTLCKPTPLRRSLGTPSSKPPPSRPLSSLLSSSSSDESDSSEHDASPTEDIAKPVCQAASVSSGATEPGVYPGEGEADMADMEGSGDAMAMVYDEEEAAMKREDSSPEQSLDVNPNLRSILLNIEDPAFAVLAAMSSNDRLEDVNAPDSPSTSESTEVASPCNKGAAAASFPPPPTPAPSVHAPAPLLDSPSTPSNASFSDGEGEGGRGQDFLIDDEISDQPGLVFDEDQTQNQRHDQPTQKRLVEGSPARSRGTLSPCSSITSEDLMLDFDLSEADCPPRSTARKVYPGVYPTNNNNNNNNTYCGVAADKRAASGESTYVGKDDVDNEDEEDNASISTDSGYSFIGHLEDDVASIKNELVTLRHILSLERDSFTEREGDLKRQIMLLKQECMEQVRVATLLREELEIYKAKDQKRHKLVIKSNMSTQTERSRPSSLGYVSEGSDGSTRSLISSCDEQATISGEQCAIKTQDDCSLYSTLNGE